MISSVSQSYNTFAPKSHIGFRADTLGDTDYIEQNSQQNNNDKFVSAKNVADKKKTNWKKIVKGIIVATTVAGFGFLGGTALLHRSILKNSPKVNKAIERLLKRPLTEAEKTKIAQNCKKIKENESLFEDLADILFFSVI